MLWANSITAFITGFGEKDIVLMALLLLPLSIICLVFFLLKLLKKALPSNLILQKIPLILLGMVLLLGFTSYMGAQPVTCASCHVMKPAVRDLSYTKHNEINCIACHKKASVFALPIQNLSQASMIINYVRGTYGKPITATVSNETCIECHEDILKGNLLLKDKRVKISHKEIAQEKVSCTECHVDTAHNKKGPKRSVMEQCSGCHNNEKASARCTKCHLGKVKFGILPAGDWSIAHTDDWPELHGTKSLNACGFCHEKKYCSKCHATDVPHPEGWSFIHGDEAKQNRDDCKTCHKQESSCMACHKITMPHPENWTALHSLKVESTGNTICKTCHKQTDCDMCHKNHIKSIKTMKRGFKDLQGNTDE